MKLNAITFVVIVALAVWLVLHLGGIAWTPIRMAGAAVAAIGLALLLTARIQLGGSFAVSAQARRLVTTGLYSRIRNPIYIFSAMFLAGAAVAAGYPRFLVLLLILVPVQIVRARREEQVLQAAFGEEYLRYKAQTWF
jgi:protein-S-isoprenylcysteine O-methyltransferase Ste14